MSDNAEVLNVVMLAILAYRYHTTSSSQFNSIHVISKANILKNEHQSRASNNTIITTLFGPCVCHIRCLSRQPLASLHETAVV